MNGDGSSATATVVRVAILIAAAAVAGPFGVPVPGARLAAQTANSAQTHQALIDGYCVTCHNPRTRAGNLTLETLDLTEVPQSAEVWERVIQKLRAKMMPPVGLPRPDAAAQEAFVTYLEHENRPGGGLRSQPWPHGNTAPTEPSGVPKRCPRCARP